MPKNIYTIKTFIPKCSDCIIFDANVLIYIFTEINIKDNFNKDVYSAFYFDQCFSKIKPFITSLQISELVNRYLRHCYINYQKSTGEPLNFKKDYRSSDDCTNATEFIFSVLKDDILPNFIIMNDQFDKIDLNNIFNHSYKCDFNDSVLFEQCKNNKLILVTDDADFIVYGNDVRILTNNQKLLRYS